jgi:histidinol-phosphate aminotransferase
VAQDTLSSQVQTLIERLVPLAVRRLNAYHVAPAKGLIKLDAMENPYPWPEPMVEQWLQRLRTAQPNRYPEPQPAVLIEQLKVAMDVPSSAELVLGNGSDELIQLVILALGGSGAVIMAPEPSFAMYRLNSEALERQFVGVALDAQE